MIWENLEVPILEGFTGFVPPDGTGSSRVMIMGEAPGEMEVKYGRAFYEQAPAGAVLARLFRRAGLERDSFVVANSVWSRPPGNYLDGAKYEGHALAAYHPFRQHLFELYRPRVVVALGGVALRTLTNYGHRGASISHVQGYVLDGPVDGTWVIGALHPSAIMRGKQEMSGVVIWALQRAMDIAKNGFVREKTKYITNPGLDDMLAFERGYNPDHHFLSADIETPESQDMDEEDVDDNIDDISYNIIRASLCYDKDGHSVSFPWQEPYIGVARRMLGSLGPKRTWNGEIFDGPRLKAAGAPLRGRHYDSMWAWKFLQPTLPRGLGFVAPFYGWSGEPWKHTSSVEPERYSCADAHALQMIADGVDAHLRQKNQWDVYERHVVQLGEVLTKMSENGLPYSAERAKEFEIELQGKWDDRFTQLQQRIPDSLKPSKQKSGLKREPKDTTGLTLRTFWVLKDDMTDEELLQLSGVVLDAYTPQCATRWCKLEPFLPTSTQQVQALLKSHNLPVGKNRKTKKDSADDEHLKKICKRIGSVKKHTELLATLQMIRECRQLNKVLGTYVKGWKPGRDGRIHATPGHWGKMFRVSWRRPNISATIQDKQEAYVASGFRRCVAVPPGRMLLESDWKGIEAVLVGWFAGDVEYQRLARLGVHDYMGIHMAGGTVDLGKSDGDLRDLFRDFKKAEPKLRDDAKHCIAEGQLVLTNRGLVPIEQINVQDAVWDGVEWVSHEGVVDQGIREVITYEGITATPDHEVVTEEGRIVCLGEAAPSLGRLETTGVQGKAIRTLYGDRLYRSAISRQRDVQMQMQMWAGQMGQQEQFAYGPLTKLLKLCPIQVSQSTGYWRTLQQLRIALYESKASILQILRRTWHRMQVQIARGICAVDRNQLTTSNLSWSYFGSQGQQWALRTGEPALGNVFRTKSQPAFEGGSARVYDIVNAGPRKCFTVSGKLVLNCVHGTNYGMGPRLMADLYEIPEKEAKRLQALYFDLFPKIKAWQTSVLDRASRECKLTNPFNYVMPLWEVYRWDSKRQVHTYGEDAKSAIAFLPRDTAAAMLKEVLLRLKPLADSGTMLCSTHDSITCEVDEGDLMGVASLVKAEMEAPVKELGGLSIGVECKAGSAWHESEMEILDLSLAVPA